MSKVRTIKDLGARVRDERKSRSLTQEELAARSGVSRRFLYQLESGSRDSFPIGKVLQILRRLNLEVHLETRTHG